MRLSEEHELDLEDVRRWYDGYDLRSRRHRYEAFAPYSLMQAYDVGETGSSWPSTESFRLLRDYVDMDFDGLQADLVRAIGGESLRVRPDTFLNAMVSIESEDDVLTLLVHLGYLSLDSRTHRARVPNEEVRGELVNVVAHSRHAGVARIMRDSILLVEDLVAMNEEAVATGIQRAHDECCSLRQYNGEEALRAVVRAALVAAKDDWAIVDELPSGHGFVDVANLIRRGSSKPALLVELKWDKPVEAAIEQIHNRDYPQVLRGLGVPILLVGVTYNAQTKEHVCRIERYSCGEAGDA